MTAEELIATARDDRRRRDRIYLLLMAPVILGAFIGLTIVPRWGPEAALIGVGVLTIFELGTLYVERGDAWQRSRALLAFACGGLAGLLVLVAQVAVLSMDSGHHSNPLYALRAFCITWVFTDFAIRQWPNFRGES